MGVKSTITLTREEAIEKYVALNEKEFTWLLDKLKCEASMMGISMLENTLKELDDEQHGGESFNNYMIVEE